MKMSEAFPSKYLRAVDVINITVKLGRPPRVTIDRCESEEMQDGEYKPVVYFKNQEKGVVLNKTNATFLADEFGDDSDDWPDQQICLTTAKVRNPKGGGMVDGIVISKPVLAKPPKSNPSKAPESAPTPAAEKLYADVDDEIPF